MTVATPVRDASELLQQLAQLDRRARLAALVNGLGLTALVVTAVIALALLADLLWNIPLAVRVGFLSAAAIAAVFGGLWALARSLLRRSDPAAIAAMLEATYPQLHERLSSIMEWDRQDAGSGSPLMRELVVREARRGLEQLDIAAPLPLGRVTRRGTIGAAVLAGLLLPCLFFGGYRLLLERFAAPWRNLERAANLYFEIEPGDATVSRGSDVEFTAAPQWRVARTQVDAATLRWRDQSGQQFERQMTWNAERSAFTATIGHVLQPFDFEVRSGRTQTREFHVDVVDRPALTSVTAIIEPPAYSGRAVEEVDGAVGDLEMLRGSRLLLQMQYSLPVDQAALRWMADASSDAPMAEPGDFPASIGDNRLSAEVAIVPEASGRFILQWHDSIGLVNRNEQPRRVVVIADEPPQVRFADRSLASRAGPRDVLRLSVSAADDIGLAALELHYQVVGDNQQIGALTAARPVLGLRAAQEVFEFDLSTLKLNEGSIISVRSRAADECPDPGPQEAWTQQQLITISERADPYESEQLAERQQQLSQALQKLRAMVAENREATEALRAHAAQHADADAPFERDAELAALAASDRQTTVEAERLAAMLDLHPLLVSLADRLRRVGREPLATAGQDSTAARSAENAKRPELLASAHQQLVQAGDELAAVQRDLEHLAELEHDLLEVQRLADDADRLAQDVAGLKNSAAEAGEPESAEQPDAEAQLRSLATDRLRNDHADLSRRLDDLLDRRPELLDSAAEHALDQLAALRDEAQVLAERERALANATEREPTPSQTESPDEPSAATDDAAAASPLDELTARQTQLAIRAVQMAVAAAEAESQSAEAVENVAREAARAAEGVESGDLSAAAEAAQQAAQQAAQAAANGATVDDPEQSGTDLLQQFAAEQQALAQQLAEASGSPETRSAARMQSQQRLAQRTQQLERLFADVSEQLSSDPLARSDDGARAADSSEATRSAQQFMESSAAAQANDDRATAVEAAQQAASQLELAAEQARSAVENSPDSPVPTDVGQQVAQASRQLRKAGEQLGDPAARSETSESDESSNAQNSEGDASQQQQANADSPMSESAADDASREGDAGEMTQGGEESELAKAAAALQAAAQRLKPRTPGDEQAPADATAGQQPGGKPNPDADSDGGGTSETIRLTDLAGRIKARSMRNWGELPGELQSELQQRSQGRPDADYAPLIRMYFNEISRRQSPSPRENPE